MGKKKGNNLGRSLIRDRFNQGHRRTVDNNSMVRAKYSQNTLPYAMTTLILRFCLNIASYH